jgi:hypothetical protein
MRLQRLLTAVSLLSLFGCSKTENITNNIPVYNYPGFTVQGITDVHILPDMYAVELPFSVSYHDSIQEKVELSLSELPEGIKINTNWLRSGYPTFYTSLSFFDTILLNPALPGTYPVTVTATGEKSGSKKYTFNIIVDDVAPITDSFIKVYPNCVVSGVTGSYADTLIKDPVVTNKVWFKNFANTGQSVAAIFNGLPSVASITIPSQQINTYTFHGNGNANITTHIFRVNATVNGSSRNITMN